jgi:hypothetical protein
MKTHHPIQYVRELELLEPKESFPMERGELESAGAKMIDGAEQSFVNAKSLISFVSAVSEQRRNDVLNSVLLAQLAANKKFPGDEQTIDWYKEFVRVLNNLGWAIEAAEFSNFTSAGTVFEVENAIIDILTVAFGSAFIPIILKTLSAIKGLSDGNGRITAFEKNTHSLSKGAFQIGLANETNGSVSLDIGTFLLTSSNEIKRILFFKSTEDKTSLDYCSRKGVLNDDVYATIRDAVETKLGTKATDFIAEIDL